MAKNGRRQMPADGSQAARPPHTAKQGQYLAFIHAYQKVHRRAPPESDLQQYFQVSLPSVHDMILRLKRTRIDSESAEARSIRILLPPSCCRNWSPDPRNFRVPSVKITAVQESRDQTGHQNTSSRQPQRPRCQIRRKRTES